MKLMTEQGGQGEYQRKYEEWKRRQTAKEGEVTREGADKTDKVAEESHQVSDEGVQMMLGWLPGVIAVAALVVGISFVWGWFQHVLFGQMTTSEYAASFGPGWEARIAGWLAWAEQTWYRMTR